MAQISLGRSSKLEFPLLQYLRCRTIFKIDIQEKDLSKIRLVVIKLPLSGQLRKVITIGSVLTASMWRYLVF